jgi:hypothetical protein
VHGHDRCDDGSGDDRSCAQQGCCDDGHDDELADDADWRGGRGCGDERGADWPYADGDLPDDAGD